MKDKRVVPIRPAHVKSLEPTPETKMILRVGGQRFQIESKVRTTELPPSVLSEKLIA